MHSLWCAVQVIAIDGVAKVIKETMKAAPSKYVRI